MRRMHFAKMLLQVEVPTESLGAHVTRERFVLFVREHVEGQVVGLVKCLEMGNVGGRAHNM